MLPAAVGSTDTDTVLPFEILTELQKEEDYVAVLCFEPLVLDNQTCTVAFDFTDDDVVERFKQVRCNTPRDNSQTTCISVHPKHLT